MAGLSVVTIGLLYHNLTIKEVGGYVFFQATFTLLDTARAGFLQNALIKFYAGTERERGEEVLGGIWFLGLVITAIPFCITVPLLFALPFIENLGMQLIIKWFSLLFLLTLPIAITNWIRQANNDFGKILFVRVLSQGSFILLLTVLLFSRHMTLNNVLLANFCCYFITASVVLASRWSHISTILKRKRESIRQIFDFGKFSVGTTISSNLLRSSDTFIINFMLGPAAVAIYNLPQRLLEIIEIPLRSFMATGITALSSASNRNDNKEVSRIMKKYAGFLTLIIVPIAVIAIIFADVAIALLGGEAYAGTAAANVFRIFMIFGILFPIERFQGVTLDMIHKPHLNLIKVLLMLTVNVVGDLVGIYLLGNVYGVALASIPTFLIGIWFGYRALRRYIDHSFTDVFKVGYREWRTVLINGLPKSKVVSN